MDARLVEFAELLRQNGLPVSVAEVLDAARATEALGVEDPHLFRAGLAATLCKRASDHPVFQRVYDLQFTGTAKMLEELDGSLARQLEEQGLLDGDELKMVVFQLEQLARGLSPLAEAVVGGDVARLARLFRGAALQLDFSQVTSQFQQGFLARRLLSQAGIAQAQKDIAFIEAELRARGVSFDGVEMVSKRLAEAMRKVEQAARDEVGRQVRARLPRAREQSEGRQQLARLPPEELEQTHKAVKQLAERLKSRLVMRQRAKRKGKLSVRRTLRKNLGWGGTPAVLAFRSAKRDRPDVLVLCDVSDSVRNVSRVMLLFVHTLQSLFHRVRSFVFVSDVGEVTQLFRDVDPATAVEGAVAGEVINLHANSNYGNALAAFARNHLGAVSRRTTVLVIGDGRNNFNPPQAWALEEIKRKARRLVWICPEERYAFGTGDSEMLLYARICHRVATVQTVEDLAQLADELVPHR